jgi:hypothetical protein
MTPADFLGRARREALRYGSDPWVFVRELLQNARDAGAHAVTITAVETHGTARLVFADDGRGMDFEHARRYLFALYASSKERERGAAGRFGVGFWSLLRWEPARIAVRSWPQRGEPWGIELDGALTEAVRLPPPAAGRRHGTEIVLERPAGDGDLARRVRDAAWQSARYACRRDQPARPLAIRVNGAAVMAPFELPAPMVRFHRGRTRGVVGLGAEARVELFAQGLRVRAASALEDLLSPEGSSAQTRVRFPALADGVAPQAILDGFDFEPLLARADVRETAGLRRLVALAQRELQRLIERQLDAVRPPSFRERLRTRLGAALALLAIAAGAAVVAERRLPRDTAPLAATASRADSAAPSAVTPAHAPHAAAPYTDLGRRYEGPRTDTLPESPTALALRYEPADRAAFFAALLLDRPFERPSLLIDDGAYAGPACTSGCVAVDVRIADGPGPLRLPVPTGHRVDPASARVDGRPIDVRVSTAGEPYVMLDEAVEARLQYRTGPAADPVTVEARRPPAPSARLAGIVARLRGLAPAARVAAAEEWVRATVPYSTSAEVAARYRAAERADPLARALDIGAGDCDVENALLVTVLRASGVRARMAVGWIGRDGHAVVPLHAWAEVQDVDGVWRIADASVPIDAGPLPSAAPPPPPGPVFAVPPTPEKLSGRDYRMSLFLGTCVGLALVTRGFLRRRTRREVSVAPRQDLVALVRGALQRPETFRHAPALYTRRLLPAIGGRTVSLADASEEANERRLFRSAAGSPLARRAAADGVLVLDAAHGESAAAAAALGAVDLDEWDAFLLRSRETPLLAAVDRRLRRLGQPWSVRAVPGIGSATLLDLPAAGGVQRIVVFDADEPWLTAAERRAAAAPAEAILAVVDRVAEHVRADDAERRRVLPELARAAVREVAR